MMAKNKRLNTKIEHVLQLAIEDFDFLQMLVKNIDEALTEYDMVLTKSDKKLLAKMLKHKGKVSGKDILQITNYEINGRVNKDIIVGVWGLMDKDIK
jgi:hypothetical protein